MPVWKNVEGAVVDARAIEEAARVVGAGEVVAYPTDTLYGLAVDPTGDDAVARLFAIKGRDEGRAIPLIAADLDDVERRVGRLTPLARRLAAAHWPGPLTLVVESRSGLAAPVVARDGTVAVRVPDHAVARALARAAGGVITSTSANRSGEPPAQTAADVAAALGEAVALILDGGACRGGPPSTLVDVTGTEPTLVRAGAVPWARVLESWRS